jgi:TolB-like protein
MGETETSFGFGQFVSEMRRRHVVRFALGYAAAAFVVLQLAEIVFPAFGIGEAGLRVLVVLTGLGFLPALVLAWVYDITTEGIKRTGDDQAVGETPSRLAVGGLLVTTILVTGGLGLYLADQGVFTASGGSSTTPVELVAYDPDAPIRALAVLPLADNSPAGDQSYFTASMHEELIAKLSMVEDVRVVSRTTVMQYDGSTRTAPEIGRELGVDVLVEGSVTRSENRVRVTLQIIHAPSDSHIRTLQWDRQDVEDVLAFQTEIAHAVVHEIDSSHAEEAFQAVTASHVDPAAQEAYFRARHEYDRGTADGYRMALEYFQEALEADSGFAAAMAGVASARFLVGLEAADPVETALAQAHEEALHALEMDSTSMEAKEVLSFIERSIPSVSGDVVVGEALAGSGVSVITMTGMFDSIGTEGRGFDVEWVAPMTRLGERIEERVRRYSLERGGEVSPERRATLEASVLMGAGRYAEAADVLEGAVSRGSPPAPAWEMLARSHIALGEAGEAADVMERWQETGSSDSPDEISVIALHDAVEFEGTQGYWAWTLDRLTRRMEEGLPVARTDLAAAHAGLGQRDDAFRYLFEALERREPGMLTLRSDPVWDELRGDPRFRHLAEQARSMRFAPPRRRGRKGGPGPR